MNALLVTAHAGDTLASEVALVGSILLFLVLVVSLVRTPRTTVDRRASLPLEDAASIHTKRGTSHE